MESADIRWRGGQAAPTSALSVGAGRRKYVDPPPGRLGDTVSAETRGPSHWRRGESARPGVYGVICDVVLRDPLSPSTLISIKPVSGIDWVGGA